MSRSRAIVVTLSGWGEALPSPPGWSGNRQRTRGRGRAPAAAAHDGQLLGHRVGGRLGLTDLCAHHGRVRLNESRWSSTLLTPRLGASVSSSRLRAAPDQPALSLREGPLRRGEVLTCPSNADARAASDGKKSGR